MDVQVSLVGRRDLTGEIYRQLRAAILDGRLTGGEALPPTRDLAARLVVSRTTVCVAYDRLVSEGFAAGRVGSGTFVRRNLSARTTAAAPSGALRPRPAWIGVRVPRGLWQPAEYDFRAGIPDASLFPYEAWRRLMNRQLRPAAVGNGGYIDPAGDDRLRGAIARHIGAARAVRASADDVIVTNGTQQAVDVIARVLVGPGDRVAVEDPGYGPPHRLFASLGAEVVGIPVDAEGLVVAAIPGDIRLIHVSPSHQFPLGMAMSLRRRLALLEWAERHGAAIIEDDYDSEFRFDGRPIEPLQSLDRHGRVIYVGSFSKTMLATLRLGFLVSPPSIREAVEAAKYMTDWFSPLPTQGAMAAFIEEGLFARHLRRMRSIYRVRHERIVERIERDFRAELTIVPSQVGLHLAVESPDRPPDELAGVAKRAMGLGVAILPLSMFAIGEQRRSGLLVGYGSIATDRIDTGLALLGRALRSGRRRSRPV